MANIAQSRKRARQAAKRRLHNASRRSNLRTRVRNVLKAVRANDKEQALAAYRESEPMLDRLARRGLVHPNKAARHKRRLLARIRALS